MNIKEVREKLFNKKLVLPVALFLLVLALFLKKDLFFVASVNGRLISRSSLEKELETQAGREILDSLVTKELVLQEVKKQKVSVSQPELDEEVKKIESKLPKDQTLDQILVLQKLTRKQFLDQIRLQKSVEKIISKDLVVTDKEIDDMVKSSGPLPKGTKPEDYRENIKNQIKQQKLSKKFQGLLDSLKKEAKISYFVNF